MSKVSISDLVLALCDLAEAESRNLQKAVQAFLIAERQALARMVLRTGWSVALIAGAVVSLLAALGFLTWGGYKLCATYISPLAAPFIIGAFWLIFALIFAVLAGRSGPDGK